MLKDFIRKLKYSSYNHVFDDFSSVLAYSYAVILFLDFFQHVLEYLGHSSLSYDYHDRMCTMQSFYSERKNNKILEQVPEEADAKKYFEILFLWEYMLY